MPQAAAEAPADPWKDQPEAARWVLPARERGTDLASKYIVKDKELGRGMYCMAMCAWWYWAQAC